MVKKLIVWHMCVTAPFTRYPTGGAGLAEALLKFLIIFNKLDKIDFWHIQNLLKIHPANILILKPKYNVGWVGVHEGLGSN